MNKRIRITLIVIASVIAAVLLAAGIAFVVLHFRTDAIRDDCSAVFTDGKYKTPVAVEGVKVIEQDVSCGYAVIEMFSSFCGHTVTEKSLYEEYGRS